MEQTHLVGQTIADRFEVLTHIASVDGRDVYGGRQPALDRSVAIKVVTDPEDRDFCQRFLREGRVLAKLDHPGIVSVIDVGEHDGRPYLVTEAANGPTLESLLETPFDWITVKSFLTALADAVGRAHEQGLVHRDLHPRNIVIGDDGTPRITDFVFAHEAEDYSDDGETQLITGRGVVVGSIEWVAPEQLMGFPVDTRADLYALGVLAYRLITGRVPHQASRAAEILSIQADGHVPLMVEGELPEAARPFAELIDRLLSPEPARRGFADASALAKALRKIEAERAIDEVTQPALEQPLFDLVRARVEAIVAPIVARAKALPRKVQLGAAGALVVLVGLLLATTSNGDAKIEVTPVVAAAIDPEVEALRSEARAAVENKDVPRALHGYRTLAARAPDAFETEDVAAVAGYLARPNTNTSVAEEILVEVDRGLVAPALAEVFENERAGRYHRRRAAEVLERLGEPVDAIPLWIATLDSESCAARRLAVHKLAGTDDPRAKQALARVARRLECGGSEARAALD